MPDSADATNPASARAVVIPFGLEASVSYGGGTVAGPSAILAASHQVEFYDEELQRDAYLDYGLVTVREPEIAQPIEAALEQLDGMVEAVVAAGKFPFVLGGEHSLTPGAIRPFARRHKDLAVLQFDAHADLRDGYQGERFSHAAAMRRVLDHPGVSLVSVGIRALSKAEAEFHAANRERVTIHWAKDQARWNIEEIVAPLAGRPLYVTFDIDALGCRRHAGDGHADAGRARLLAGARHPAAGVRGGGKRGGRRPGGVRPHRGLPRLRLHGGRARLQDAVVRALRAGRPRAEAEPLGFQRAAAEPRRARASRSLVAITEMVRW